MPPSVRQPHVMEDSESELLFQLDGSNQHDLSTFPHMSVQLWELYRQDIVDRGWTTQFWERKWQQSERENAARMNQQLTEGQPRVQAQVATQPELRPPWLVHMYRDMRFVRNTGSAQVVNPEQLVIWGTQSQIFMGARSANLRLSRHAFNLTFLDLTGKKVEEPGDGMPAVAAAGAGKKTKTKAGPPQGGNGQAKSKASGRGASKVTVQSEEPVAAVGSAASVSGAVPKGLGKAKRRRPRSARSDDDGDYEEDESNANIPPTAMESSRKAEQRSRGHAVSYEGLDGEGVEDQDDDEIAEEHPDDQGEVECIFRDVVEDGVTWFLIKWKGCAVDDSPESTDWKTREELASCSELLAEWEKSENMPLSKLRPPTGTSRGTLKSARPPKYPRRS